MFKKLLEFFARFKSSSDEASWFVTHRHLLINSLLVVLASYIIAVSVNATLLPKMMKTFSAVKSVNVAENGQSVAVKNLANYHEIRKAILDRNVFNQSGDFPKEESDESREKKGGAFDMDAPCEKPSLKVKLLGVIAMDGRGSIATILEEGFLNSDVYNEGDYIIGSETAQIVAIQRSKVIINNAGRKECLELNLGEDKLRAAVTIAGDEVSTVDLDYKYVKSELGEGFGKIIQSAHFVPNVVNNQVNGFKLFQIQPDTIFQKIGFKENDVITKVNNVVMEAEQGFYFYQALNDEKQIRVNLLRNGVSPKTIVIRVK